MDRLSVAGLTIGLALIGVSNLPVVWSVFRTKACEPGFYRDEDGEATESSVQALGGRWPLKGILGFSLIGLACASATAVIATTGDFDQAALLLRWCQFGCWVSLSLSIIS